MALPPKVSVILTSFNHANYLREAIDSVLNQTVNDFELIVWDDASTDDSWEIIQSYTDLRIKAFRNEKQMRGVYGINRALSEVATGEYIAIHHSDDLWDHEKLEKQLAILTSQSDIGAVFSWVKVIDENGEERSIDWFNKKYDRWELLRRLFYGENHLNHPSVLIRRSIYEEIGVYKCGLAQTADAELWSRLLLKYDIHILEDRLVQHRLFLDGSNTSGVQNNGAIRTQNEWNVLRRNFLDCTCKKVFLKIFPSAVQIENLEPFSIKRALALVALDRNLPHSAWGFGLEILYQVISISGGDGYVSADYGFKELIVDSGCFDVFGISNSSELAKLNVQVSNLNYSLGQCNEKNMKLTQVLTNCDERLKVFDEVIERNRQSLQAKDHELEYARQGLQAKDQALEQVKQQLQAKDHELEYARQGLQAKDQALEQVKQQLQAKDHELGYAKQGLQAKDQALQLAKEELQKKEYLITQSQRDYQILADELKSVERELVDVYKSSSWVLMRPLRNLKRKLSK